MCSICGNDNCIGKYLLHPMELCEIPKIKAKELSDNPNRAFLLVDSTSSGEIFTKFKELHVIENRKESP